jgi:hypothetical protein
MTEDHLTIRLIGREPLVAASDLLSVLGDALKMLDDVGGSVLPPGEQLAVWHVSRLQVGSPASVGLYGETARQTNAAAQQAEAVVRGMAQLEQGAASVPRHFRLSTLATAKHCIGLTTAGLSAVEFALPGPGEAVRPTVAAIQTIEQLLPRKRETFGTLRGRLETLTQRGRLAFTIWGPAAQGVTCHIGPELLPQAAEHFGQRVAVQGRIQHDEDGTPKAIRVLDLRWIKEAAGLPGFRALEGMDITEGLDSVAHVRGVRDGQD